MARNRDQYDEFDDVPSITDTKVFSPAMIALALVGVVVFLFGALSVVNRDPSTAPDVGSLERYYPIAVTAVGFILVIVGATRIRRRRG